MPVDGVGSSSENALDENINGFHKTHLIKPRSRGTTTTTSNTQPLNGRVGTPTAGSTNTAETCRPPSSTLSTAIGTTPSNPLSCQTCNSPDTPGRVTQSAR